MMIITEIVTWKLVGDIEKDEFISIVDRLEKDFHSQQLGFIDSELLYDKQNDTWIMIQHWDSLENMHTASKKMFNNPVTDTFVNAIDPKTVKMIMLPQIGAWSHETVLTGSQGQ